MLNAQGFVPGSCTAMEMDATTAAAWSTVSLLLAKHWALVLQQASTLYITTCITGATMEVGWGTLNFAAGYDYYPECLRTTGAQQIAGIALLETAVSDDIGVYMLTLYSDLNASMLVVRLCFAHTRKHFGHPVSPAWNCGHNIDNSNELIVVQIVLIVLTLMLPNGDIYNTYEDNMIGIRGFIRGKPVLTYALLSGLERRKILLLCITLNAAPSLTYLEVSRIYLFSVNGYKIWCFSCAMLATYFSFLTIGCLSLISAIPVKWTRCILFSAPIYLYVAILSIYMACSPIEVFTDAYSMNFGRESINLGISCKIVFIVDCCIDGENYITSKQWLMSLEWHHSNGFIMYCGLPFMITSLPLDKSHATKIENKIFCRPSKLTVLGYTSVVEKERSVKGVVPFNHHKMEESYIIDVYGLGLALLPTCLVQLRPRSLGSVLHTEKATT
ncbi:hypothetical protein THRCLA_02343 [Thraustotheca clavata]|uniref:Transmembrane protein n=1 Tax=Thraustotheca clavata TaxID=74557 RepID=A0A1W0A5J3_9STRA|nr:hypothetical protein THRCLA_02343 [Thraustotheca clavata]